LFVTLGEFSLQVIAAAATSTNHMTDRQQLKIELLQTAAQIKLRNVHIQKEKDERREEFEP